MRSFVLIAVFLLALPMAALAAPKNLESPQAKTLLAQKRPIFILDVRTPEEYRQAHLRGAVLIPVNELARRMAEVPKNRTVLVYCAVGSRSAAAAGFLAQKGYGDVYNMADGIVGWYKNGFPIDR